MEGVATRRQKVRLALVVVGLLVVACGSSNDRPPAGQPGAAIDAGAVDSGTRCGTPAKSNDDGTPALLGTVVSLRGRVLDPAGKNPLYGVSVYVARSPNLPLLTTGVSCDRCASSAVQPIASTLTDPSGSFVLDNVPTGTANLVVQVGKWRKLTTLQVLPDCNDVGDIRLPASAKEGDLPQIAVTTGEADALECVLELAGIDKSEFVAGPGGTGHVHMFNGKAGLGIDGSPDASTLWNDAKALSAYDIVLLSCEGAEINETKTNKQAIHDYANAGGRIFASHYQYTWFKNGPNADFQGVANWGGKPSAPTGFTYNVEQGFPKGKAFAQWLQNVGASPTLGLIDLNNVKISLSNVNTMTSQAWLDQGPVDVKYFSFNTPVGAAAASQCGRVVFSDVHVSEGGGEPFGTCPRDISSGGLTPQEKALEFLFFDLSACVESDSTTPAPPR